MLFRSQYPDIECPTDLTVWEWAFEDKRYSPLFKNPPGEIAGFTDAVTGERLDFGQVKEHATYTSSALVHELGMKVGDTVSLFGHNRIWYPVTMFAVLRVGGRINGASPSYTIGEMVNALKTAGTKYIMTVTSSIKMASAAAKEVGIPSERILLMDGDLEGYTSIQQLSVIGRNYGLDRQFPYYSIPAGQTNDVCGYLNFSSGTTGLPKAVMLSHKNIIAQCLQLADVAGPKKKRFLACLPLFHSAMPFMPTYPDTANSGVVSGLVRFLHWPIASNDECVMLPQFTMENVLEAIVKYRITDLTLVPAIVIRLINDPIVDKYDLTSVKVIACGAAPVGTEVIQRLHDKMPWTGFRQSYGMTESCCCLSTHPPEFYDYKYGNNAGKLLASTVVKIVDVDTGKELGPNETGEILAKGPQIAMGYLNNAKETAETFGADGFLRTGDIGKIDSQGFIHIIDRIKEMIKVKGQQVAPADLEQVLLGHPYVADCAILGIPDAYSSEMPKAFIVLKSHVAPNAAVGHELMHMKVVIADRNLEGAEEACQEFNKGAQVAWAVQADVGDWESQKQAFEVAVEKLGRVDYVFPIAGITERPWNAKQPSGSGFVKPNLFVLDVNATGALYTCSLAIQQFRTQEPGKYGFRGKIVVVSSACGFYCIPSLPIYTAAKHAMVGFVRTHGKLLPEEAITLNAICPTIVKTGISTGDFYDKADAKGLLITVESLVKAFENLLGDCETSGEAIEILPGDDGSMIKERPEYSNEKCKVSCEMVEERTYNAFKALELKANEPRS
ncbi:hypothetical protein AU210_011218 [Fusarium oxysporum f. sp. radicis-cucumerinum]|uniref:Uncharacterized protein n=2 Tax=Fusarium oxysporum TaxID=5507 RepID=A0A2H3GFP4_FUSOX|nr:hypothetical protein AU210_011218 [Fusarium oxysporum f. sp. radicis-cucumerinum]